MLNELQDIRRLLSSPTPDNVRIANAELRKLPSAVSEFAALLLAKQEITKDDVRTVVRLRSEVATILLLLAAALDYFRRLSLLRVAGFGDYERTGELKPLETVCRTIGRL
jgi:hypothetical protein